MNANFLAFGHDHRGHGLSEGKKAYIEDVEDMSRDVIEHCRKVRDLHPGVPLYLLSHSMGGMVAISAVLLEPQLFQGLVLQGPLVIPGFTLFNMVDFRVTPLRYVHWARAAKDMWG